MRAQKRPRHASASSPLQPDQNLNGEQNDEYTSVKLSKIRKEVQCPICLGILRKTRTVMECLHRFCKECIDKSMRLGNHECPLCRTHCSSRRSLRDDPNFDALIAAIYPDIDKYEEEELASHEEDGTSKKQIGDSTAQTLRQQSEALGRKRSEKATASACAWNVARTRKNLPTYEHQGSDDEGGVESASGAEFYNDLSTDQIGIMPNDSLSDFIEAVAVVRLCVARFQTEQEAMKNSIRSLTEELKMSTDQVSRLDKKIAELETTNHEQSVRLQKLGQVQDENPRLTERLKVSRHKVSGLEQKVAELETINKEQASKLQELEHLQGENPQLVKECIRRLFRTKGFEDFIWKLLIPAYKYGAHRCAVSVMDHNSDIPLKVFEGKGYDPTIAEELDIVCANALMSDDLDFPLLQEIASLAEPLTLSTLKRLVVDENTGLANPNSSPAEPLTLSALKRLVVDENTSLANPNSSPGS